MEIGLKNDRCRKILLVLAYVIKLELSHMRNIVFKKSILTIFFDIFSYILFSINLYHSDKHWNNNSLLKDYKNHFTQSFDFLTMIIQL